MKKFFKAKQLIKSMVQNDYLPGIYKKAAAKGEVDPKKVIFADAHSNGLTENMIPVARALKKRGYSVKVMCRDIGKMNMIDAMSFMRQFMMEYATSGMIFISSHLFRQEHQALFLSTIHLDTWEVTMLRRSLSRNYLTYGADRPDTDMGLWMI